MADGAPAGAERFRCVLLLSKTGDEERAETQRSWLADDPIPAMLGDTARRYVRSVPLASEQRGFKPRDVFGVVQVWVDDLDTALSTSEQLASAMTGALGGCTALVIPTRELVVIDGPERPGGGDGGGLKGLYFACRLEGMSVADFQGHWREIHGPLVVGTPGLGRYVQCHPCPEAYGRFDIPYDSMAEMTFADEDALAAFGSPSPQMKAQGEDAPTLWSMQARSPRYWVRDEFDTATSA